METVRVTGKLDLPGLFIEVAERNWDGSRESRCNPDHVVFWLRRAPDLEPPRTWLGSTEMSKTGIVGVIPAGIPLAIDSEAGRVIRAAQVGFGLERFYETTGLDCHLMTKRLADCADIRNAELGYYLRQLVNEAERPGFAALLLVDSLSVAIMVTFSRFFRDRSVARPGALAPWRIRRLREHVESHPSSPCRLEDLARLCGISAGHLSRAFKDSTGMTVHGFVQDIRLAQAKRLLAETDRPVKEIAYELGFAHPPAFATAFRKLTGETPGNFRLATRR